MSELDDDDGQGDELAGDDDGEDQDEDLDPEDLAEPADLNHPLAEQRAALGLSAPSKGVLARHEALRAVVAEWGPRTSPWRPGGQVAPLEPATAAAPDDAHLRRTVLPAADRSAGDVGWLVTRESRQRRREERRRERLAQNGKNDAEQ